MLDANVTGVDNGAQDFPRDLADQPPAVTRVHVACAIPPARRSTGALADASVETAYAPYGTDGADIHYECDTSFRLAQWGVRVCFPFGLHRPNVV